MNTSHAIVFSILAVIAFMTLDICGRRYRKAERNRQWDRIEAMQGEPACESERSQGQDMGSGVK